MPKGPIIESESEVAKALEGSHSSFGDTLNPSGNRAYISGSFDIDLIDSRPWRSDAGSAKLCMSKLRVPVEERMLGGEEQSMAIYYQEEKPEALYDDTLGQLNVLQPESIEASAYDHLSAFDTIPRSNDSVEDIPTNLDDPLAYFDALAGENNFSPEDESHSRGNILGDVAS